MTAMERTGRARPGKISPAEPRNWEDVNQRLACLGELERQMQTLGAQFQQKVAVLKQQWLEVGEPLERERERLQGQIERFYWAHRQAVLASGRKSVELVFGCLGSRRSCRMVVRDPAAAQQWLAAHGLEHFLRTRTEIDREAIRSTLLAGNGLGSAEATALASCPAMQLQERDEFWFEVHPPSGTDAAGLPRAFRLSSLSSGNGGGGKHLAGEFVSDAAIPVGVFNGRASP